MALKTKPGRGWLKLRQAEKKFERESKELEGICFYLISNALEGRLDREPGPLIKVRVPERYATKIKKAVADYFTARETTDLDE